VTEFDIQILPKAEYDLRSAFLWYEEKSTGLGIRFEVEVDDCIKSIAQNPYKFQKRYKQVRLAFLSSFPFGVHYTIREQLVLIVAVFHTSLDPNKWLR
jgi:plasmid stabilization system protein ParE